MNSCKKLIVLMTFLSVAAGCRKARTASDDTALVQSLLQPYGQAAAGHVEDIPTANQVRATEDAQIGKSTLVITKSGTAVTHISYTSEGVPTGGTGAIANFGDAVGKQAWLDWEDKVRPPGTYTETFKDWKVVMTRDAHSENLEFTRVQP